MEVFETSHKFSGKFLCPAHPSVLKHKFKIQSSEIIVVGAKTAE
jgi:hypothetical protein